MRQIPLNIWFPLPWLGQDIFPELRQAGVKYDKRFGFKITSETDVPRALHILSAALDDEVQLEKNCFVCDRPLEEKTDLDSTLCPDCLGSENAFLLYSMKFARLVEAL